VDENGSSEGTEQDEVVIVEGQNPVQEVKAQKSVKKANPLETVKRVISAPSFSDITVVD
jgi:hypothetical protein